MNLLRLSSTGHFICWMDIFIRNMRCIWKGRIKFLVQNTSKKMAKSFHGKAIYNPSGKAGEYSQWACNFYVGCSNDCEYCYCKKGILAGVMGQNKPQLKKCFRDEIHALIAFERELKQNLESLRVNGLFFTFTSDPMLPETYNLTFKACDLALEHGVPVKILTKSTYGLRYMNEDAAISIWSPLDLHLPGTTNWSRMPPRTPNVWPPCVGCIMLDSRRSPALNPSSTSPAA